MSKCIMRRFDTRDDAEAVARFLRSQGHPVNTYRCARCVERPTFHVGNKPAWRRAGGRRGYGETRPRRRRHT